MRKENQDKLREAIKHIKEVEGDQPEGSNLKTFLKQALSNIEIVLPPQKPEAEIAVIPGPKVPVAPPVAPVDLVSPPASNSQGEIKVDKAEEPQVEPAKEADKK